MWNTTKQTRLWEVLNIVDTTKTQLQFKRGDITVLFGTMEHEPMINRLKDKYDISINDEVKDLYLDDLEAISYITIELKDKTNEK